MHRSASLIFIALAITPAAHAQIALPAPNGYVNDFADVISASQEAEITRVIQQVRTASRGVIVVVTLASLQGRSRGEVALQIGREWKVGQAGGPDDPASHTGTVVLVVPGERQMHIALGTGTSTFISDEQAGRIRDEMTPHFRKGDFGTGIQTGVNALAARYAVHFGFSLYERAGEAAVPAASPAAVSTSDEASADQFPWAFLSGCLVCGTVLAIVLAHRRDSQPLRIRPRPRIPAYPTGGSQRTHRRDGSDWSILPATALTPQRSTAVDDDARRHTPPVTRVDDSSSGGSDFGGGGDFGNDGAGGGW
jgi:uncharacterized protein